jgi:pilus assembly protein CpaB
MDGRKLLLLAFAVLCAVGTALAARSLVQPSAAVPVIAVATPSPPKGPRVLVAQRDLPTGTILTADTFAYREWPRDLLKQAYIVDGAADSNALLGTVVRFPVAAGEPIARGALVSAGDRGFLAATLGPGMRAVTIPVSVTSGGGGFVFPGDRIDMMLTQGIKSGGDQELKTSETILCNLRVLATDQFTQTDTEDGKSVIRPPHMVTLEVTPRMAEKIAVAQMMGDLSLSLRPLAAGAELDRVVATGTVSVPANATREQEEAILRAAVERPIDVRASFVTGGDVSRFQPSRLKPARPSPTEGDPSPATLSVSTRPAPDGPIVRVTRGKTAREEPARKS